MQIGGSFIPFPALWMVCRYSKCHLLHISWWNASINCQCLRRLIRVSWKSSSGTTTKVDRIKKCPGVSTDISEGSFERGVRGFEFSIASPWVVSVINSEWVRTCSPVTRWKAALMKSCWWIEVEGYSLLSGELWQVSGYLNVNSFSD